MSSMKLGIPHSTYFEQKKCEKSFSQKRIRLHHDGQIDAIYHRKPSETHTCQCTVQFLDKPRSKCEKMTKSTQNSLKTDKLFFEALITSDEWQI